MFLRRQQHSGTREALRRHLLQLSDPALQDIALTALVDARDASDESILRECLDQADPFRTDLGQRKSSSNPVAIATMDGNVSE